MNDQLLMENILLLLKSKKDKFLQKCELVFFFIWEGEVN